MAIIRRKVLVYFMMFSLVLPAVFAQEAETQDRKVMSLGDIDDLISANEYSQALEELSFYIQTYPDQFDKAQRRISKVLKARNSFNKQAFELAEKMRLSAESEDLTDEQADVLDTQKMDIILALEKSEQNPAQEEIDLTNDARRTVRLSYYINRSNLIMHAGIQLIGSGTLDASQNYDDGFGKFREGLGLKTNDSDIVFKGDEEIPVVYPDKLNREVDFHIAAIRNHSKNVKYQMNVCQKAYEKYRTAAAASNVQEAVAALEEVKSSFARLAGYRNSIYQEGNELRRLDAQALALNPGLDNTSYITFSRWAVLGVSASPDSGMVGAIDAFWNTRVESLKNTVYETIQNQFSNMAQTLKIDEKQMFTVADLSPVQVLRQNVTDFADHGKEFQNLYGLLTDCGASGYGQYKSSLTFVSSLAKNELRSAFGLVSNVANQNAAVNSRKVVNGNFEKFGLDNIASAEYYRRQRAAVAEAKKSTLVKNEKQRQKIFKDIEPEASVEGQDNDLASAGSNETAVAAQENTQERTTAGVQINDNILDLRKNIAFWEMLLNETENECNSQAGHVWAVIAKTYSDEADSQLAAFTLRNARALLLLNGTEEKNGEQTLVKYYPTKASEEAVKLNKDIASSKTVLTQYRITLDGGSYYKTIEEDYAAGVNNIDNVIQALNNLVINNNKIIADAKIKSNEARKASNEARQKYDQAVKYLKNNKYDEARTALSAADASYKQSLLMEENDELRREFSEKIARTDEQITVSQNEWVITTTRQLITDAYNDYYSGNFENAKRSLDDAADVWAKTQAEENGEVKELASLVKDALELTGGKEILYSDPLYKDMGAYLSNARQHYTEGAALYNSGKKEEGTALLVTARDEVRKVQRVFPKNLEANNLNLVINKILDPDVYKTTVNQKIAQAKATARSGKEVDMKSALNELKELQQVIPDNKTVASAVKDIEKQIARSAQSEQIKKDNAESERLVRLALAEKNVTRKIALLDEALKLNPRNANAQKYKDQAYIKNTATTTVKNFLSDADEVKYAQAERYYNDGLRDQAVAIITDLYKRNPQVSKVIKLKRRIENM